ncbi:hypothetical protein SCUCBS95973_001314 [Sporothrix curviconia]|uniref:Uncharacterized protein n=1 Tax=Sporothrix curviconia TaxID=1260050 RepID=A0ABP0AXR8_9PEZI
MAPADLFAVLVAAAAAPATATATTVSTAHTSRIAQTAQTLIINTITTTAAATTAVRTTLEASHIAATSTAPPTAATPSSAGTCWPGTCSPDIAVSFGPFRANNDDGSNSRVASTWGGAAFAGAFGLLALAHLIQGCRYRWKPAAAAVVGGLVAMAGYILQATGSALQATASSIQPYLLAAAFVLLQLAPLCITLYAYLLLERLAHTRFLPAHDSLQGEGEGEGEGEGRRRPRPKRVWPSNGRWIAHWPVVALLTCASAAQAVAVAFLVYGGLTTMYVGHALLVAADIVWAAGLAAQGVVILVLLAAVTQAFATLPPARPGGQQERGVSGAVPALSLPPRRRVQLLWLLGSTYGVLALLTMRLVFRTVQAVLAAEGRDTAASVNKTKDVLYALVFEALPMCLALALLSVFHAGWALPLRDVQHLQPGSGEVGGGGSGCGGPESRSISRRGTGREDGADGAAVMPVTGAPEGDGLLRQAPVPHGTPLEPRGVRFGLPPPTLTPAQILIQQRAIIQRQRQQQRQQWRRQWQRHRETAARGQASMQSVSLPSSPVVEALARSSLSASLTVSLPRESFVAERPDMDANDEGAADARDREGRAAPRLLARLSRDNFILFRFLNAPSRSPSSGGGGGSGSGSGWQAGTRMTASVSGQSRQSRRSRRSQQSRRTQESRWTPHSNRHSGPSQGDGDGHVPDDLFAGFDGVGTAGRYDYGDAEYDAGHSYSDNERDNDNDSHRTCDSPNEKRGAAPEWP